MNASSPRLEVLDPEAVLVPETDAVDAPDFEAEDEAPPVTFDDAFDEASEDASAIAAAFAAAEWSPFAAALALASAEVELSALPAA